MKDKRERKRETWNFQASKIPRSRLRYMFRVILRDRKKTAVFRRTQTTVPEEEFEMSVVEGLQPVAPSSHLLVDENSQCEGNAEQNREECRRGVTCNRKTSDVPELRKIAGREMNGRDKQRDRKRERLRGRVPSDRNSIS